MRLTLFLKFNVLLLCSLMSTIILADEKGDKSVIFKKVTMHSQSLEGNPIGINAERELLIVLPPSYNSHTDKTYPVVYLLHGLGSTADNWFSEKKGEPNVKRALQKLYDQQQVSEMIIVVPNSYNEFAKGGWYSNSSAGGNWEDYIIKDVIPYIDEHYRTNLQRGLTGHSMGGYGAFRLAIKYPQMFGAIYPMSASLADSSGRSYLNTQLATVNSALQSPKAQWQWSDTFHYSMLLSFSPSTEKPLYIHSPLTYKDLNKLTENSLDRVLARHLTTFKKYAPVIKFDVGTQDEWTKNELMLFAEKLKKSGINASYSEYVGTHSDKLDLLTEVEIFQYFSQFFTNQLPEVLPPSLIAEKEAESHVKQHAIKPQIIELDEVELVGMQVLTKAGSQSIFNLWTEFYAINIDKKSKCKNSAYIGLSQWTENNDEFYYLVGCQKKNNVSLPEALNKTKVLAASQYAVFTYKGAFSQKFAELFDTIYDDWLPNSEYEQAGSYNFEFFGDEFEPGSATSVMYIYVPIKNKLKD